jgi:hypothetical protein
METVKNEDFAVRFGTDPLYGRDPQKAFPFFYTLINKLNDTWTPSPYTFNGSWDCSHNAYPAPSGLAANWQYVCSVAGTITTGPTLTFAVGDWLVYNGTAWTRIAAGSAPPPSLGNIAVSVPPGQQVTIPVVMDPDYNFKILGVKYIAYWNNGNGGYDCFENPQTDYNGGLDEDASWPGKPYYQYINVTLWFNGAGSKVLYGGMNPSWNGGKQPLPIQNIQGHMYGFCTVRTPYLLPRQGHIMFDVTNSSATKTLQLAALIYGMKVRV